MKRTIVLILVALAAIAMIVGLTHLVLVATHRSEPAAATVYGTTARRLWASGGALLALASVIVGGVALARPANRSGAAMVAVLAGMIAAINGGLVLVVADGGPGSGNGVVGGAGALVLGAVAVVLGALGLARRTARRHSASR
jgi:hypothetical protein